MKTDIYTPNKRKGIPRQLESIVGDCLEEAGLKIPHGGYAIIDCNIVPRVGDLVHCDNKFGTIHGFIKQVKEFRGDTVVAGTAYEDASRDYTFEASTIYGVVTEVFCKLWGERIYCRDEVRLPLMKNTKCRLITPQNTAEKMTAKDYHKQEWISVEDRLPDNHERVLIACKGTTIEGASPIAIGSYGGGLWSIADADGTAYLTKYMYVVVTHWMPLPEAPKMKGE